MNYDITEHDMLNAEQPESNDLRNPDVFTRRVRNIMTSWDCNHEDAVRYLELRDEGYNRYQAALMAGISDPH